MHLSRPIAGAAAACLIAASPAVASSRPDLRVVGLTDPPSQLSIGQSFSSDIVVQNIGKAASTREGQTSVSLVEDPHHPEPLVALGHVSMPRLKAGHSSTKSIRVQLPAGMQPGRYFLWVCADSTRVVTEANERNNCFSSAIDMQVIPA
jgi:hypothetical protein